MCDFKPGDEVICVRGGSGSYPDLGRVEIVQGRTYTVEAVWFPGDMGPTGLRIGAKPKVQLAEFGLLISGSNANFDADRFRKVRRRDLNAWLETAAADTDHLDKPIKRPARPQVEALQRRLRSGAVG